MPFAGKSGQFNNQMNSPPKIREKHLAPSSYGMTPRFFEEIYEEASRLPRGDNSALVPAPALTSPVESVIARAFEQATKTLSELLASSINDPRFIKMGLLVIDAELSKTIGGKPYTVTQDIETRRQEYWKLYIIAAQQVGLH